MVESTVAPLCLEPSELVEQATGCDAEAFGQIYQRYERRIYRYIYYRVGSPYDAEDLTEQVFLNAWRAIGRYQQRGRPILAWLFRMAHNLVIDYYRTQKKEAGLDEELVAEKPSFNPGYLVELHEEFDELHEAIRRLNAEQQRVITLRFVEGMCYPEVAAILGKREGAVRVLQHRALIALRRILREQRA